MGFSVMVACTADGGIGRDGNIPWYCSKDLKYFQKITTECEDGKQNAVIMGRKTWESLPKKPLKNRKNIVLSRSGAMDGTVSSLEDALKMAQNDAEIDRIFVIGGGEVYREAIMHPDCERVYMTVMEVELNRPCDTFFPIADMLRSFEKEPHAVLSEVPCTFQEFLRIGAHHTTST